MKYSVFFAAIFCFLNSFAQVSVSEKKRKYTIYNPEGKVLMKKQEAVKLFDNPEYKNMFAVYTNGFCTVYLYSEAQELITVTKGNFSKAELNEYVDNRLMAFDFFDNQYIIESDGTISDTFDYYENGLRGGTNNVGKVALCSKNKNITEYKYHAVFRLVGSESEWFIATTDEGDVVLDVNGKQMMADGVQQVFASAYYDSLFICEKNGLWSVVDLEGRFKLEPTHLIEPYLEFMFDGLSYSELGAVEAIFLKNGKQGVINLYGKEIITPIYDELFRARSYEYNDWDEPMNQLTSFAVKPNSKEKKWIFLDAEMKELLSFEEDQFITTEKNFAIFLTDGQLKIYDMITGAKSDFASAGFDERFEIRSSKGVGIADSKGRLILPCAFYRIDQFFDADGTLYYAASSETRCDFYKADGNCITSTQNFKRISEVCNEGIQFLRIENDEKAGIGIIENGSIKIVIPMEFDWISCFSYSPDKLIATGEKDGETYNLFRDGSIELQP